MIDAEDTDAIVLSSLVSHIESGVLGIRRKKSSFYCNKLCSPELASILVKLLVLIGSFSRETKMLYLKMYRKILKMQNYFYMIFNDA